MTSEEREQLKQALLREQMPEFDCGGDHYLIQIENNKGWDYLGLWRVSGRPVCLCRAIFDSLWGVDEETAEELLSASLPDGTPVSRLLEQAENLTII